MDNLTIFHDKLNQYPVIFSLPHSGTTIPDRMKQLLQPNIFLPNTDWFLREFYDFLSELGFTVIQNNMNHYVADPNREDIAFEHSGTYQTNVVYQSNIFGTPIYAQPLTEIEIQERLTMAYYPYHRQLENLIAKKFETFKHIYLIDLHSFATYSYLDTTNIADFVIGNQQDQTSSKEERMWLTTQLEALGFTVSDNVPFKSGYINTHYGKHPDISTLQLDIRYNKYIDTREFGEEELRQFNPVLFTESQNKMKYLAQQLLKELS